MEEKNVKFIEKLQELLAMAKKKKNVLEYREISDFFHDMELDAEQFEKILDFLESVESFLSFSASLTTMMM